MRRRWAILALTAVASSLAFSSQASAGVGAECPQVADKPGSVPHVDYPGVQHLTYCQEATVKAGQNFIRLNTTKLLPQEPGYITRFDPELVYTNGTVPPVDIVHLHHAVWLVNFQPQFAAGEEKTIVQMPYGFGWRSTPNDQWLLNDMLHDLTGKQADVYMVWRIDFVPDSSPAAAAMRTVKTQWMDVAGLSVYPVFDVLRSFSKGKRYTFPNQAPFSQLSRKGLAQSWTADHAVTLISTVGHLHPGGIKTGLRVRRGKKTRSLFQSRARYYEPAGAVSWDVSMGATPENWRVKMRPGDVLSVNATYDTSRADWYEVMGIMPVAVYDGVDVGGRDAFSKKIPQKGFLTHGHLAENDNHGGGPGGLPNPSLLRNGPLSPGPIMIDNYQFAQGGLSAIGSAVNPPTIYPGQRLTFFNNDASYAENTYHTITSCKAPCNRTTGVAYPLANGPVSFDSGELGYNWNGFGAPAKGETSWTTSKALTSKFKPGTYSYFCRIHPFMRGSFRVLNPKK